MVCLETSTNGTSHLALNHVIWVRFPASPVNSLKKYQFLPIVELSYSWFLVHKILILITQVRILVAPPYVNYS